MTTAPVSVPREFNAVVDAYSKDFGPGFSAGGYIFFSANVVKYC